ncbi:MarR family transcriptional regulator [Sphingomonas sp. LB-2]|uniref:MarR family winged helix-turn-helix transcriptional regulator n=1 Tax=Sphingomonas caeni TaxID=2984949 RepID=UPI002231C920|nr:MarR family transcriptional regulator [Sphingomonas caeni]MCW3848592.1 MarR family transcriptional regulator [Sphingomonas caeni]
MQNAKSRAGEALPEPSDKKRFVFGPSQIPYRILLLSKMIDRVTAQHVRDTAQLSLAQWRVLTHVEMMGKCSAAEVASVAYSDRAEVSRAIASLEERGLIQRETHPRNRKSSLVSLTAEGNAVHAGVRGERGKFYEQWLMDLDDAERAALGAALEKITDRIVLSAPHMFDL